MIIFQCGCQSCGSTQLEICRAEASSASTSSSSSSSPALLRTESSEVASLINVPRQLARLALNFAGGDVNTACRNLLLSTLDPSGDPPFLVLARSELTSFGGVTSDVATSLLEKFDNDIERCKQELMKGIFEEEILWDAEGREIVRPRVQYNTTPVDCAICMDDANVGEALILGGCAHSFCLECLRGHVTSCMAQGNSLISCPSSCGADVTQAELREIVGMENFAKIDRRALEQAVSIDPSLHHCPTPDCVNIVCWSGPDDGLPICDCGVCHKKSCLVCGHSPYHIGNTCEQHRMANTSMTDVEREENERAFQEYVRSSNIRTCGRCGNAVVKSSGCNKMKCRCGYRFCFECGVENALCEHTPSSHGFIDNASGGSDFSNLRAEKSPT